MNDSIHDDDLPPVPDIEAELGGHDEPPQVIKPEEGIEELKAKLLSEQRRREQLEEQAAQASRAATFAFQEKEDSDIALVQSALQQVAKDTKELKAAYAAAAKSGEFDKMADIALEMQAMVTNGQQLEQGLEALKERAIAQRQQQRQPQRPTPREEDPVESVASRLTPASAKWVRQHPEYATEPAKLNKMVAAHYEAVAEGIKADSPEYFEFVEQKLGVVTDPEPRQTPQRQQALRSPPPAAPARGNSSGGKTRTMTLSPLQREMARASGLTDEEYAANLVALRNEGKISTAH